jgi:predicted CopG family antitoxin
MTMHVSRMATKTISLELDAYERLRRAKRSERESFSEVVRRAVFPDQAPGGAELLAYLKRRGPVLDEAGLDELDAVHEALSRPAEDPWEESA